MYKWNIDDLKQLLIFYSTKKRETTDAQVIVDCQNSINSINSILDYYKEQTTRRISYERVRLQDIIDEDMYYLNSFKCYMPIVKGFRNSFDGHLIEIDTKLHNIDVSDSYIVSLSSEFYGKFKGIFSDAYHKLANNFRNRLWFRECKKNMTYGGNTYEIYGSEDVFIEIFRNNTVQDFITSFHEMGHGITSIINKEMKLDYKKYCFIETETLFFEILSTFFISSKLNLKDDCYQIRLSTFNDYLYSSEILCAKEELYTNCMNLNRRKILKFYTSELGYSKLNAKDALNFQVNENLHYIISYLTAVELFYIYLADPALALSLLYKIILLNNLNPNEYLLKIEEMGIEPGKNIQSFYNLINDENEVLKYEKKI